MINKETTTVDANNIAVNNIMEVAIQRGTEAGIKAAMHFINDEKRERRKGRCDRRLRNTRLLLRNYRSFKTHVQGAVYNTKQMAENAVDVLDSLDDYSLDDDLYVESIKKTQQRTLIILKHIDEMLRYYQIDCEKSHKDEDLRRYRIIMDYYINDERRSVDDIAEKECIEKRTLYKDINIALKPLTALFFGIDSLKIY